MDIEEEQSDDQTDSQQMVAIAKYILEDEERGQIEKENMLSLLFLTILLSAKREFFPLSKCILRSLNEKQIDCSRWYKYGLSLYGNNQLLECIRACHHSLQNDTTIDPDTYALTGTGTGSADAEHDKVRWLRHHFVLSACLLATRSALLLHDYKSAVCVLSIC